MATPHVLLFLMMSQSNGNNQGSFGVKIGFLPKINISMPSEVSGAFQSFSNLTQDIRTHPTVRAMVGQTNNILIGLNHYLHQPVSPVAFIRDSYTISLHIEKIVAVFQADTFTYYSFVCIVMSVYSIIEHVAKRLPPYLMKFLGIQDPTEYTEEYLRRCEQQFVPPATAESPIDILNMFYTYVINNLPGPLRSTLDAFQKYTRIRILEDIDWVQDISAVILSIPEFILGLFNCACVNFDTLAPLRETSAHCVESYRSIVDRVPGFRARSVRAELSSIMFDYRKNKKCLASPGFVERVARATLETEGLLDRTREAGREPDKGLIALYTEVYNLRKTIEATTHQMRQEPVAFLIFGPPGKGKTVLLQQLVRAMTENGMNTAYHNAPKDNSKNFYDRYNNQNIWVHEDLGQTNIREFAPYVQYISSNPVELDAAEAPNKGILYFQSTLVLATTNFAMHLRPLVPTKDCGFIEPNAIYRRFTIYNIETHEISKFNLDDCRYRVVAKVRPEPLEVFRYLAGELDLKKQTYSMLSTQNASVSTIYPAIANRFEGRVIKVGGKGNAADAKVAVSSGVQARPVFYLDSVQIKDVSHIAQQAMLDQGLYINGRKDLVEPFGEICITKDLDSFNKWLGDAYSMLETETIRITTGLFEDLVECVKRIPAALQWSLVLGSAIALLGIGIKMIMAPGKKKQPEDVEVMRPFIHFAKPSRKRQSKNLYADYEGKLGDLGLNYVTPPTEAMLAVRRNILKATYYYSGVITNGYLVMVDGDTAVTTAHLLLETSDPPTTLFIRAYDSEGVERVSTHFRVQAIDMANDVAYLKYLNPHAIVFRSLKSALNKTPSSKKLYLLSTEGAICIDTPTRAEVTSGYYGTTKRLMYSDKILIHNYDGIAKSAPGLCGSVALTEDGYIVGWHVAGTGDSQGYVRFWDDKLRDFVQHGSDSEYYVQTTGDLKNAMQIDRGDPLHKFSFVNRTSQLVPSRMMEPMMKEPLLSDNGQPLRVPAVLKGKDPVTGESIYDRARLKNLKEAKSSGFNQTALKFAQMKVRKVVTFALDGKKMKRLNDEEVVKGYVRGNDVLNAVNKDASSGTMFPGCVGDYVDMKAGTIDPKVTKEMSIIEDQARRGIKDMTKVAMKDAVKDERRDLAKQYKPRLFAAGPIQLTLLMRRHLGSLQAALMRLRNKLEVMIGINATSEEWHKLWLRLIQFNNHFDGDYENFDGGMIREFQELLNEVLVENSEEPEIVRLICSHLCETLHVGMDLSYITTHTVPSGHGLTAVYNSLINLMYIAYAYYVLVGKDMNADLNSILAQMELDIFSPVYGDDVVLAVSDRVKEKFNAITYTMVMTDIGLGFTSASKSAHSHPFDRLADITFLKRGFVAHRALQRIVGPLQIRVLAAMCSHIDDATRDNEISRDKVDAIQRELFLHDPNVYTMYIAAVARAYEAAFGVEPHLRTRTELMELYYSGDLRTDLMMSAEGHITRQNRHLYRRKMRK